MNAKLAKLICRCSKVSIEFTTSKPLYSLECCCVDCYQKNEWSSKMNGETFPFVFGTRKPLTLSYFLNRFTVVRGEKHIGFNRLREDSESVNMIATCCDSLLCVDYPSYNKKQVLTFPEFQKHLSESDPVARVWIKDWNEEELRKLDPLPSFYVDHKGSAHGDDAMHNIREGKKRADTIIEECDDKSTTTTFQNLLKGNEIQTLGLQEIDASFRLQKND